MLQSPISVLQPDMTEFTSPPESGDEMLQPTEDYRISDGFVYEHPRSHGLNELIDMVGRPQQHGRAQNCCAHRKGKAMLERTGLVDPTGQ